MYFEFDEKTNLDMILDESALEIVNFSSNNLKGVFTIHNSEITPTGEFGDYTERASFNYNVKDNTISFDIADGAKIISENPKEIIDMIMENPNLKKGISIAQVIDAAEKEGWGVVDNHKLMDSFYFSKNVNGEKHTFSIEGIDAESLKNSIKSGIQKDFDSNSYLERKYHLVNYGYDTIENMFNDANDKGLDPIAYVLDESEINSQMNKKFDVVAFITETHNVPLIMESLSDAIHKAVILPLPTPSLVSSKEVTQEVKVEKEEIKEEIKSQSDDKALINEYADKVYDNYQHIYEKKDIPVIKSFKSDMENISLNDVKALYDYTSKLRSAVEAYDAGDKSLAIQLSKDVELVKMTNVELGERAFQYSERTYYPWKSFSKEDFVAPLKRMKKINAIEVVHDYESRFQEKYGDVKLSDVKPLTENKYPYLSMDSLADKAFQYYAATNPYNEGKAKFMQSFKENDKPHAIQLFDMYKDLYLGVYGKAAYEATITNDMKTEFDINKEALNKPIIEEKVVDEKSLPINERSTENIVAEIYENLQVVSNPDLLPSKEVFVKDFMDNYNRNDAIQNLEITTKNRKFYEQINSKQIISTPTKEVKNKHHDDVER
jgi:hypothetical protein